MDNESLIFQTTSKVTLATNSFVNVPIILKYEDTNLIEVVKEADLGFTTAIPIYHSDGTYLAKVRGTRMFPTNDGKKVGLKIEKHPGLWVCKMESQTLFEIHQEQGDTFRTLAELYTPDGYFVKCSNERIPDLIDDAQKSLKIGGLEMSGNTFIGCRIGIWLRKDGSGALGVN